jgi:outer membrane protein assembly factor BamB
VLYLPVNDSFSNGTLYALSASDGSQRWRYTTDNRLDLTPPRPVIANGTAYFIGGDHTLYALKI